MCMHALESKHTLRNITSKTGKSRKGSIYWRWEHVKEKKLTSTSAYFSRQRSVRSNRLRTKRKYTLWSSGVASSLCIQRWRFSSMFGTLKSVHHFWWRLCSVFTKWRNLIYVENRLNTPLDVEPVNIHKHSNEYRNGHESNRSKAVHLWPFN